MRKEVLKWWEQSKRDLLSAKHSLDSGDYYVVAFLCQQSVEKALKALVMGQKNIPYEPSHSLIYLGKTAKVPARFHSFLRELTSEYTLSRYPDASEEVPYELYDKVIASEILHKSSEIIEWIKKQLK